MQDARPPLDDPRLDREHRTLAAMMRIYCRQRHATAPGLCPACADLLEYARRRLERCPFQGAKPTCVKCPIHCYQARPREEMRTVMRVAGPRMLWEHPLLAMRHLLDGRRPVPPVPNRLAPHTAP